MQITCKTDQFSFLSKDTCLVESSQTFSFYVKLLTETKTRLKLITLVNVKRA